MMLYMISWPTDQNWR